MKRYYTRTFGGLAVLLAMLAGAAMLSNRAASETRSRYLRLVEQESRSERDKTTSVRELELVDKQIGPMREFAKAWRRSARVAEKGSADRIRSDIESIAQRQLGLVTDGAITPQPERYPFQGTSVLGQRVSLRASGKDLAALLTWLGNVEERYPAAIIEHCEFTSNVGGNTGLAIRLVQPLEERSAARPVELSAPHDAAALASAMAAQAWRNYLPARVKAPVAVGFQRNPLQPAIAADRGPLPPARDDSDEITSRVEAALDGRVRSVIRGASPLVVVDGRMFRIGDEIVVGAAREKPVPEAKTKLKGIGADALFFQVSGGSADFPVQCDVRFALPSFLSVR